MLPVPRRRSPGHGQQRQRWHRRARSPAAPFRARRLRVGAACRPGAADRSQAASRSSLVAIAAPPGRIRRLRADSAPTRGPRRAVEDPPRAGAGPRRPAAPRSRRRSPTHAQVRQAAQVGQGERARGLTFGHGAASILAGVTLARAAAASRQRAAGSGRSPSSRSAHARARRSAPLARSTR